MPDPRPHPGGTAGQAGLAVTTTTNGGRVVVASDALLAQLDSLGRLAESLRLNAGALIGILNLLEPQGSLALAVPPAALEARRLTHAAAATLLTAQNGAEVIATGVLAALSEYSEVERFSESLGHQLEENLAWGLGAGIRLAALPTAFTLGAELLVGSLITKKRPSQIAAALQAYLKAHGRILTSTATVTIVRHLAADADGIGAGLLLLPVPVAAALDSSRLTGVSSSSDDVVDAGRAVGLFEPTGSTARKTSSYEYGSVPTSLADRSQSFPRPDADPNGEQIRIDRYVEAGKPDRFDVYIAGTVTFNPTTGTEPFDLQSDLNGVGGLSSASYDSVLDAMKHAGITSSSPVVLNGYSQGGLLASQIAASGQFNVHGVVTFGAPSAQVAVPASIPVLTVRNSEDLVPATSGFDVNPHAVIVERPLFTDTPVPTEWAVPAHELSYYQQTAAVVDRSTSSEVRGVLDPLNQFGAGADRVDSTLWQATRTH